MHPTAPLATRRYVKAPTGQVHIYDAEGGDGTIPLVLLHQAPTSSLDYAATFPAFARAGQRVLAMDLPGMGMSDAPAQPATIMDYVAALKAVMDDLKIDRAHLLGHHTGVKVAVEFAAAYPERTGKLVLYGMGLSTAEQMKAMWDRLVPYEQEGRIHKPEPGGAHLSAQFQRQEYYGGPVVAHRLLLTGLMAGPKWWYGHNAALTHDFIDTFLHMKTPMMLMTNPGEMMRPQTEDAAQRKPDARLVTLKTEGAIAMDTDPEEFVGEVVAFLREP